MLVTGVVLGVFITLLCLYILYLRGAVGVITQQNKVLLADRTANKENLARLAAKVQDMQRPIQAHFTDEQLHQMAIKINDRVVRLYEAKQAEELQKLN
jgi:hypothetical protein